MQISLTLQTTDMLNVYAALPWTLCVCLLQVRMRIRCKCASHSFAHSCNSTLFRLITSVSCWFPPPISTASFVSRKRRRRFSYNDTPFITTLWLRHLIANDTLRRILCRAHVLHPPSHPDGLVYRGSLANTDHCSCFFEKYTSLCGISSFWSVQASINFSRSFLFFFFLVFF